MKLSELCLILAVPIRVAILQYLHDNSPCTVRDVARVLFGAPTNVVPVRRHLRELCSAGLCQRVKIGREQFYTLASNPEALEFAIQQLRKLFAIDV